MGPRSFLLSLFTRMPRVDLLGIPPLQRKPLSVAYIEPCFIRAFGIGSRRETRRPPEKAAGKTGA